MTSVSGADDGPDVLMYVMDRPAGKSILLLAVDIDQQEWNKSEKRVPVFVLI